MSSRVYLLFPLRGHESPPTLCDRLNLHFRLQRRRFPVPPMPNARMSLCAQSVHSFSFPPRPLRTAPSRFRNTNRFGSRPPLIRMSVPAHKNFSFATSSQWSHTRLSQGHCCTKSSDGPVSFAVPRWHEAKDSVVYGAEIGVVFLAKGTHTASMQEGLDCLGLNHSGLEGERGFRLVVELPSVPPDAHPACAGPSGDFKGHVRDFGHCAP